MNFNLSPQHETRREEFRSFAAAEIAPACGGHARENIQKLAARGYMGLPVPREWDGSGQDFLSYILLIEEISRRCASTGVILAVHTSVGTFPLLYYGSEAQKKSYLPGLAAGRLLGAFALTEAGAGSDAAALRTTAVRQGDSYRLDGTKLFITSGGEADLYTVFASTDPGQGARGISAFLVKKGTPGLVTGTAERKMGLHGTVTTGLIFEDAAVPRLNRLGKEGDGFKIAMALLDGGRIGIAAQGLGLARAALEETMSYLLSGSAGTPGPAEQGIRFTLADIHTRLEAARLLVYRAALLKESGQPCSREASMAKVFATDLAVESATRCLDLWARGGCRESNPVTRYFRDAKITQIYEGSNQIQRMVIARDLLKGFPA